MSRNVTSRQLTHAAVIIIMTTSLLAKHLYMYTKNDAWAVVIAATLICLVIYKVYALIASKFPGQDLIDINDAVFGPVIGKIISLLYIYFFFTIAALNVNVLGGFVNAFILPSTPGQLVLVVFVAVCLWAVRKGAVNFMRYSVVFSVVTILIIIVNALILSNDFEMKNFLPSLNLPLINYVVGTHSLAMIPLSDPLVLFVFLPMMQNPEKFGKAIFKGLVIGASVLLIIVLRDIVVQGVNTQIDAYPSFSTIRLIDVGDIITRMEIIYSSVLIALVFYKVTIFFYAAAVSLQRLMRFNSYRFYTNCFAVMLIVYAVAEFTASNEHAKWLMDGSAAIHHTIFVLFLPLLTLVVAVFRGYFREQEPLIQ